jgi:hypothetical protein
MVSRVTITLPTSLAEAIANLAAENLRPPKDQIVWLLKEAIRSAPLGESLERHADERDACAG